MFLIANVGYVTKFLIGWNAIEICDGTPTMTNQMIHAYQLTYSDIFGGFANGG